MKIDKLILSVAVAVSATLPVRADLTMSPYSRYGYGMLTDNATSAQRSMGGVGYAMNSGRQINVMNPASYAAVDSLTFLFDIGLGMTKEWSSDKGGSGQRFGGGLDYVTMLFPVSKTVGVSLGLLPYSSVGYSFGNEIEHGYSQRTGSGGLNQLYLGAGWEPIKGLSVGANVSYLFGTTYNDLYANTDAGGSTLFQRVMEVQDFHLQFGAQYSYNINRENRLTAGITFAPGKTLLGHTWGEYYDINAKSAPDTVGYTSLKDKYSLAPLWGVGVAYEWNQRVLTEVDFTFQPWSKARYAGLEAFERTKLTDRYKVAMGVQWTPQPRGNYLQRCRYRLGGYLGRDYVEILGNKINEQSASVGIGFPAPAGKTLINVGVEYKHRKGSPSPLVKEEYVCLTIGVNFNEMWFWRNKIR